MASNEPDTCTIIGAGVHAFVPAYDSPEPELEPELQERHDPPAQLTTEECFVEAKRTNSSPRTCLPKALTTGQVSPSLVHEVVPARLSPSSRAAAVSTRQLLFCPVDDAAATAPNDKQTTPELEGHQHHGNIVHKKQLLSSSTANKNIAAQAAPATRVDVAANTDDGDDDHMKQEESKYDMAAAAAAAAGTALSVSITVPAVFKSLLEEVDSYQRSTTTGFYSFCWKRMGSSNRRRVLFSVVLMHAAWMVVFATILISRSYPDCISQDQCVGVGEVAPKLTCSGISQAWDCPQAACWRTNMTQVQIKGPDIELHCAQPTSCSDCQPDCVDTSELCLTVKQEKQRQLEAAVILLNSVFVVQITHDWLINENEYAIVAFIFVTVAMFGRSVYIPFANWKRDDNAWFQWLNAGLTTACNLFYIFMVFYVKKQFGVFSYRICDTNLQLRAVYRRYSVFVTALKVDLQCQTWLLAAGFIYFFTTPEEKVLSALAAMLTAALLLCGYCGARDESICFMYIFWAFSVIEPAYIVYKIHGLYTLDKYEDVWRVAIVTLGACISCPSIECTTLILNLNYTTLVWNKFELH
jgi:hypothetical protein